MHCVPYLSSLILKYWENAAGNGGSSNYFRRYWREVQCSASTGKEWWQHNFDVKYSCNCTYGKRFHTSSEIVYLGFNLSVIFPNRCRVCMIFTKIAITFHICVTIHCTLTHPCTLFLNTGKLVYWQTPLLKG